MPRRSRLRDVVIREALSQKRDEVAFVGPVLALILKTMPDGGYVRLSDVGQAEFGAEDYTGGAHWNVSEGVGFGVIQMKNANALEAALTTSVRATLEELPKTFTPGGSYVILFDATRFVRETIKEVVQTLAIAVLPVAIVIYAFSQN